jgi:hypothetical protein
MLITTITLLAAFEKIECPNGTNVKSCHEYKPGQFVNYLKNKYFYTFAFLFLVLIMITVISLIMSIWLLLIAILLIQGVKKKKRSYIMLYLIVCGVCAFCYLLQTFTGGPAIKTTSAISMLIHIYGFIILYSLYEKIGNYVEIS